MKISHISHQFTHTNLVRDWNVLYAQNYLNIINLIWGRRRIHRCKVHSVVASMRLYQCKMNMRISLGICHLSLQRQRSALEEPTLYVFIIIQS